MERKTKTAKCTLCGLEVTLELGNGNDRTNIDAAAYSRLCKQADAKAGFDCPRLQEAINKAR